MNIAGKIEQIDRQISRINNIPEVVEALVSMYQDVLLNLNRDQMLLGRDANGDLLTPDYLSDPYFKTPEQAQAYANMKYALDAKHKARMSTTLGYPDKPKNTPNLIVTGPFQDEMFITASVDSFMIGSTYVDSNDIEAKYNNAVFGLAPLSRQYFYLGFIKLNIWKYLRGLPWDATA